MKNPLLAIVAIFLSLTIVTSAHSETPEQWVELGTRIHGAFGAFIPVGIRIGLDAKEKLKADARGLAVTFYNGQKSPCPCIADGVMIATQASPGQRTLQIASEKAPPGFAAVIVIRNRKTGEAQKYSISDEWLPKILGWNKSEPLARFDAAMTAHELFKSEPTPQCLIIHQSPGRWHRLIAAAGRSLPCRPMLALMELDMAKAPGQRKPENG